MSFPHLHIRDVIWLDQVGKGAAGHLLLQPLHCILCLLVLPTVLLKSTSGCRHFVRSSTLVDSNAARLYFYAAIIMGVLFYRQECPLVAKCQRLHLRLHLQSIEIVGKFQVATYLLILLHLDPHRLVNVLNLDAPSAKVLRQPRHFILIGTHEAAGRFYWAGSILHGSEERILAHLLVVVGLDGDFVGAEGLVLPVRLVPHHAANRDVALHSLARHLRDDRRLRKRVLTLLHDLGQARQGRLIVSRLPRDHLDHFLIAANAPTILVILVKLKLCTLLQVTCVRSGLAGALTAVIVRLRCLLVLVELRGIFGLQYLLLFLWIGVLVGLRHLQHDHLLLLLRCSLIALLHRLVLVLILRLLLALSILLSIQHYFNLLFSIITCQYFFDACCVLLLYNANSIMMDRDTCKISTCAISLWLFILKLL